MNCLESWTGQCVVQVTTMQVRGTGNRQVPVTVLPPHIHLRWIKPLLRVYSEAYSILKMCMHRVILISSTNHF